MLHMICASIILLIGHLAFGTVYHVVLSDTVNTFKTRLDKFWQHQDVIYDFRAEIHGTGSRSCYYILVLVLVTVFWNIRCGHRGTGMLQSSFHYVYVTTHIHAAV